MLSTRHIPICPSGNDPWVAWLARLARCTSWSCRCLLFFPAAAASLWAWLGSGWCSCSASMGRPGPLDLCEACVSVGPLHASQGFVWPPSASNHTRARSRLERQASAPPRFAARADETSADAMLCFACCCCSPIPGQRLGARRMTTSASWRRPGEAARSLCRRRLAHARRPSEMERSPLIQPSPWLVCDDPQQTQHTARPPQRHTRAKAEFCPRRHRF